MAETCKNTQKEAKYALNKRKVANMLLFSEMVKIYHNMPNKDTLFGIIVV